MKIIFLDALLIQSETDVNLNRFIVSREGFLCCRQLNWKGLCCCRIDHAGSGRI